MLIIKEVYFLQVKFDIFQLKNNLKFINKLFIKILNL